MYNHLVLLAIGNIGTGKSSFISKLNQRDNRVIIQSDAYDENYPNFIRDITHSLALNKTLVLEGLYINRSIRVAQVINPLKTYIPNVEFICFDFGPGNSNTLEKRLTETDEREQESVIRLHNKNYKEYITSTKSEGFKKVIHKWQAYE